MSIDDVVERLTGDKDERNRWVGVYIGILAVLLAICSVGGGNATKDADRANIEAVQHLGLLPGQEHSPQRHLACRRRARADAAHAARLPPDARKAVEDKIKDYRDQTEQLTKRPRDGRARRAVRKGKALERSATWPCARTPISTGARRCCRSPSCWPRCSSSSATPCLLGPERQPGGARRAADAQRLHPAPPRAVARLSHRRRLPLLGGLRLARRRLRLTHAG